MDPLEIAAKLALFFVPFLFSLSFHEFAHGWVANLKGDSTARLMGRLNLNPLSHADPFGTFLIPGLALVFGSPIFFGWAKPVPVNTRNLKNPKTDMFWIALAGPLSNIILALIGIAAVALLPYFRDAGYAKPAAALLSTFVMLNVFLALFNLIPLHPLDGGKILARFLPDHVNNKLEENQNVTNIILLAFILMGGFSIVAHPVHEWVSFMMKQVAYAVGL